MRTTRTILIAILALCATKVHAQDKIGTEGLPFLNLPPNVRSMGMGRAGAAVEDPFVSFFNPGGLGVYAGRGVVGAHHSSLYDGFITNTLIHGGLPACPARQSRWPAVSLAFAFQRSVSENETVGSSYSDTEKLVWRDRTNNFTLAAALEKGAVVGVGGTLKSYRHQYDEPPVSSKSSATAHDAGVFIKVPVLAFLREIGVRKEPLRVGSIDPELVVITSYAWATRGGDIVSSDPDLSVSLPGVDRFGRSIALILGHQGACVARFLITRDDEMNERAPDERRQGWECDILGVAQIRRGRFWTGPQADESKTTGWSVHAQGILDWLGVLSPRWTDAHLPWYVSNFDFIYQRASYKHDAPSASFDAFKEFGAALDIRPLFGL